MLTSRGQLRLDQLGCLRIDLAEVLEHRRLADRSPFPVKPEPAGTRDESGADQEDQDDPSHSSMIPAWFPEEGPRCVRTEDMIAAVGAARPDTVLNRNGVE